MNNRNYNESENYLDEIEKRKSGKIQLHTIMSIIIYSLLILVVWCFLSGCSAERRCQIAINNLEKKGCLKQDSFFVYDTFIVKSLDTTFKFDTLSLVDTIKIDNKIIITRWKKKEIQISSKADTTIITKKVPKYIVKYPDCPKLKWYHNWKNIVILTLFFCGIIIGFLGSLKRFKHE